MPGSAVDSVVAVTSREEIHAGTACNAVVSCSALDRRVVLEGGVILEGCGQQSVIAVSTVNPDLHRGVLAEVDLDRIIASPRLDPNLFDAGVCDDNGIFSQNGHGHSWRCLPVGI